MQEILIYKAGVLKKNENKLRRLFTTEQEKILLIKALMSEVHHGAFSKDISDAMIMLELLKHNAKEYHNNTLQALILKTGFSSITSPMLVYEETQFTHSNQTIETVLIPIVYLPKSMESVYDHAGGLYAFNGITLQGSGSLEITGNLHTGGKLSFSDFKQISHKVRTITEKITVTDSCTSKSMFGLKKKTTLTKHKVEVVSIEPGNTIIADGVTYDNIGEIKMSGLQMLVGNDGVQTSNIDTIVEKVVEEKKLASTNVKQKQLMGSIKATISYSETHLHPTIIVSKGKVNLNSNSAIYDAIQISGPHSFNSNKLSHHQYLRDVEAENRRIEAEMKEAKRTAKRKRIQMIGKMIIAVTVAYFGGTFITNKMIASSMMVKGSMTAVITKGAIIGGISSGIMGRNPIKGAITGAIFAGVEDKIGGFTSGKFDFIKNDPIRDAVIVSVPTIGTSVINSIIKKENILESLVISSLANISGNLAVPLDSDLVSFVGNNLVTSTVSMLGYNQGDLLSLIEKIGVTIGSFGGDKLANNHCSVSGYSAGDSIYEEDEEEYHINYSSSGNKGNQKQESDRFHLPSVLPKSDPNKFLDRSYAVGRAIEHARDNTTHMIIHPIETISDLGVLLWDVTNLASNTLFNISTNGSKIRNQQRIDAINNTYDEFKTGTLTKQIEMGTEFVSSLILGTAFTGPVFSRTPKPKLQPFPLNPYDKIMQTTVPSLKNATINLNLGAKTNAISELERINSVLNTKPLSFSNAGKIKPVQNNSIISGITKPKDVKYYLTPNGLNNPVPLLGSEVRLVLKWTSIRNRYLKKWNDRGEIKSSHKNLFHSEAETNIKYHMTPDDLAGILKEQRNQVIVFNGKKMSHLKEGSDALKSLTKTIVDIKKHMNELVVKNRIHTEEYKLLHEKLSDLSKLKDFYITNF
jgi:hypothetical protein